MDCCKRLHCKNRQQLQEMSDMNGNNSISADSWVNRSQLTGTLYKKPFGHQSNKWSKRFFVIRDGFILYYPEGEKKDMLKRKSFNIHPKGVLPLGECTITPCREQGQPNAFYLDSPDIQGRLILAADSGFERDKWQDTLEKSKRVTYPNAALADHMIKQLEERGRQIAKQKQDYFDQLQNELSALSDEKEKTEELERINQELAREKQKIEEYHSEVLAEYEKLKGDLNDTTQIIQNLETSRIELSETLRENKAVLESLQEEKEKVLEDLQSQQSNQVKLSKENKSLHMSREQLEAKLKEIELKTETLLQDKIKAEERLLENEEKTKSLEDEKSFITDHAEELKETIKDLKAQKERTEAELKEEVIARMEAEKKLREAEASLFKLDHAVTSQTPNIEQEIREEMVVNVNKLKKFFEGLAEEAKMDSEKPSIIKNSIHARKTILRRAKTKKFQRARSNSLKGDYSGSTEEASESPLKRASTQVRRPDFTQTVSFPLGLSSTPIFSEDL